MFSCLKLCLRSPCETQTGKQATKARAEESLQVDTNPAVMPTPPAISRNRDPIPPPTTEASGGSFHFLPGQLGWTISVPHIQARGTLPILLLISVVLQTGRTLFLVGPISRCSRALRASPQFSAASSDFHPSSFSQAYWSTLSHQLCLLGRVSVLP